MKQVGTTETNKNVNAAKFSLTVIAPQSMKQEQKAKILLKKWVKIRLFLEGLVILLHAWLSIKKKICINLKYGQTSPDFTSL